MNAKKLSWLVCLVVLSVLVTACGQKATPTPVFTPTSISTATPTDTDHIPAWVYTRVTRFLAKGTVVEIPASLLMVEAHAVRFSLSDFRQVLDANLSGNLFWRD